MATKIQAKHARNCHADAHHGDSACPECQRQTVPGYGMRGDSCRECGLYHAWDTQCADELAAEEEWAKR